MELNAIGEVALLDVGRQELDNLWLSASFPKVDDFIVEQRVLWPVEANGVGMVELKRHWFTHTITGQVDGALGLGGRSALTVRVKGLLTLGALEG